MDGGDDQTCKRRRNHPHHFDPQDHTLAGLLPPSELSRASLTASDPGSASVPLGSGSTRYSVHIPPPNEQNISLWQIPPLQILSAG